MYVSLRVICLASLSLCNNCVIPTLRHGSRKGSHSAACKPSRQSRRPQRHAPTTTPFILTTAETLGYVYVGHSVTSITKLRVHTWRSFHIRHLVLAILLAAPPPSTCPHGGSLHCHKRPLPPRHLVFHFPTTSGLPQALPLSHLSTSAPSCFSLPTPSGLPQALPLLKFTNK